MNQASTLKLLTSLLVVLMVLTVSVSSAQSPTSQKMTADEGSTVNVAPATVDWQKVYGGSGDDRAFHAVPVGDGFLVVGSKTENDTTVGWALRLNADGSVVWNKTYLVGDSTELRYIVPTSSGYWFIGNAFNGVDENGLVQRVDVEGNNICMTTLGGGKVDKLFSGVADADRLTVFGLSYSYSSGASLAWAVNLDENGDVVWNRTYGQSADSALRSGVLCKTGGYITAGYIDTAGEGNYDFYLLQLDSEGNMVWNKTLGSADSEKAYSIATISDGYVIVGDKNTATTSTDAYIIKVDGSGNQIWARTLGGKEADSPAYVTTSADDNILVCGFTFSAGAGNRDYWLTKLSTDGKVLFSVTSGDEAFQEAYTVIEAGDRYVLFGWTDPQGQPDLIGKRLYDFWVVKLGVPAQQPVVSAFGGFEVYIYIVAILVIVIVAVTLVVKLRKKR